VLQNIKKHEFSDKIAVLLSAILGAVVFLLIYGPYSLNVCKDAWILNQYDGPDIIQNYAGWTQFRRGEWAYPLGLATDLAYGDGTYITYTDSIPYLAIVFKLIRGILPATFQYFGWFTLTCFVLQGIGACLLIKRKHRSYSKVILGDVFFLTAPILIERAFKHTALGAHWFILFSLYFCLEYHSGGAEKKLPWQMLLLSALTVGIHPYFLPMVMIFVLVIVIEAFIKRYTIWKILGYTAASVALPYGMGVLIGALGTDIKHNRSGYGVFGVNLNSLFNPSSHGGFTWSKVLEQRPWALQNYEGFNYLGLGILLMAGVCLVLFLIDGMKCRDWFTKLFKKVKRNILLLCCMSFMVLFALTNNICFDNKVIFSVQLPSEWMDMASIFRASGRMFYPVTYLIMLVLIDYLLSITSDRMGIVLLAALLFIQVYDMREVFTAKYATMKENYSRLTIMDDETLSKVSDKEVLMLIGRDNFELERILAVWAARQDMGVAYSIANTGEYPNAKMYTQGFAEAMEMGVMRSDIVYVTMDGEIVARWREALADDEYIEYKRGYYFFVYKE